MKDSNSKIYNILLAGNPNVGKSTVFNALTGMKQHTGNWAGKTVAAAQGCYNYQNCHFNITDLPGTYSLSASSPDEAAARDAVYFMPADCIAAVVDATSLEKSINLVLQILSITTNVVVCVNLCDEAEKKCISIDFDELSLQLGVPVVKTSARSKKGLEELKKQIYLVASKKVKTFKIDRYMRLDDKIEKVISDIEKSFVYTKSLPLCGKSLAIHMITDNAEKNYQNLGLLNTPETQKAIQSAEKILSETKTNLGEVLAEKRIIQCAEIYRFCIKTNSCSYSENDRKLDKVLTSKLTGIPVMLLLFALIFYITIIGANYPSEWLSQFFSNIGIILSDWLLSINTTPFVYGILIDGIYSALTNIIAVMLPPMAIFFPLFTLLEDLGYLPRVAFNLDRIYCRVGTNGKQSLTALMGFGCNACGVTGCRIFESKRDSTIAVITNNFSPCNGRFPTIIAMISAFLIGTMPLGLHSFFSALVLVGVILLGIIMSLAVSKILSLTLFRGQSDCFVMELPPFRPPQIIKTIVRSLCDRTVFILLRAIAAAIPAGIIIWILANIQCDGKALIIYCTEFLDPFAKFMGLDGTILTAFILGFPANEIVLPIAMMIYTSNGTMVDYGGLSQLHGLLILNGWTVKTAVCTILFSLMHFPCATTCITIYKETKSLKTTALSIIIPTICGIIFCIAANLIFSAFGY